jgi:hypothetical protein
MFPPAAHRSGPFRLNRSKRKIVMNRIKSVAVALSTLVLLEGCASTPTGPRVQVLPAPNKPFEVFAQEDTMCRQFATNQVNGQAEETNTKTIGTALIGGVLGAGLGAAVGGGRGAGIGAAAGTVAGTAVGASNGERGQGSIQQQYDNAYSQCMYAKGNQVVQRQPPTVVYTAPPAVVYTAPPPVVYTAPPPTVYAAPPPAGYAAPPAGYAAPPAGGGYAPPPPPPNMPPPQ